MCPGLFEQLGPIQQYYKLCRAESNTDVYLVKYQWEQRQGLNLERVPRDLLVFEEINIMFFPSEVSIN